MSTQTTKQYHIHHHHHHHHHQGCAPSLLVPTWVQQQFNHSSDPRSTKYAARS
jgi:hypothetical protein